MAIKGKQRRFLVVVDDTPECKKSLRFACRRAKRTGEQITMLRVIQSGDFQHWLAVEERMRDEAKEEAQALLRHLAEDVFEEWGIKPQTVVSEKNTKDAILDLIEKNKKIGILVLGAAPSKEGPGPLVSQLVGGNERNNIKIPITVVPGDLSDDQIDDLT